MLNKNSYFYSLLFIYFLYISSMRSWLARKQNSEDVCNRILIFKKTLVWKHAQPNFQFLPLAILSITFGIWPHHAGRISRIEQILLPLHDHDQESSFILYDCKSNPPFPRDTGPLYSKPGLSYEVFSLSRPPAARWKPNPEKCGLVPII